MSTIQRNSKIINYLFLLIAFIIFSLSGAFLKLASREEFATYSFFIYFSLTICIVGIYAILWQIILKKVPLAIAFMSKSITIVFALLIAHFIFEETITINNIIGSFIIISGIIYLNWNK